MSILFVPSGVAGMINNMAERTDPPVLDYSGTDRPPLPNHPLVLIAISYGLSFLFAVTFVIVMTLTLPVTDGAHAQMRFQDPLVFPVMLMGAGVAGTIVCLPTCFLLRTRRPGPALSALVAPVMLWIIIVTPRAAPLGMLGSVVTYLVTLVCIRLYSPPLRAN